MSKKISGGKPAKSKLSTSHAQRETHYGSAGGHILDPATGLPQSHAKRAGSSSSLNVSHKGVDTQHSCADVQSSSVHPVPTDRAKPTCAPSAGWTELRICADLLHRTQEERKAVANMLRHTDPDMFADHLARLEAAELAAQKMLVKCYKRVAPRELFDWQQTTCGLGDNSIARILGHLGDPYIATPHWWEGAGASRKLMVGEPYVRTVGQLWQYCGHGDQSKPTRGMSAEDAFKLGNPTVKMLVHLQAEWCIRSANVYRDHYDKARERDDERVHTAVCVRCGPSGKPAQIGSPWSKGHQHAHALRIVGKELLRDMWITRHNQELSISHVSVETHRNTAGGHTLPDPANDASEPKRPTPGRGTSRKKAA